MGRESLPAWTDEDAWEEGEGGEEIGIREERNR